jgi:hypothetical protein
MKAPVVVIEQPNYFPWVGYFDLMAQADVWVWYDDVQYTRRDWRNRNQVAGRDGVASWLTVPVQSRGRFDQLICDVALDNSIPWARRHLATLRHCYAQAPFFARLWPPLEELLSRPWTQLAALTVELGEQVAAWLGIAPTFLRSSTLTDVSGTRQERLLAICQRLHAGTYLSGPRAQAYIEPTGFIAAGHGLRYVIYGDYPYPRPGSCRQPLSVLDPLFWIGPEATRALCLGRSESAYDAGRSGA